MNRWTWGFTVSPLALLILWLAADPAAAQPAPSAPAAAPPAEAVPAAPAGTRPPEPAPDSSRPTETAIAIGVGYTFPTSLQTPNTTSVRLRLPAGLTFEPQLVVATSSNDVETTTTVTNKQSELTFGALVHYPLQVRRKVDLEILANAAVSSDTVDPNGDSNNRTTTTFNLGYGIGLA